MICEAISSTEYKVVKTVVKNRIFMECHTGMRNHEEIEPKQFYRIVEKNWNHKKEVDHWNYWKTGEFIEEEEPDFLQKLYMIETVKDVKWGF